MVENGLLLMMLIGIIAHHADYKKLIEAAKNIGYKRSDFVVEYVYPESTPQRPFRILPIRIRAVKKHDWSPNYTIGLISNEGEIIEASMLIDSGADISVITKNVGEELGLIFTKNDLTYEAGGVGGGIIQYALKQIEIQIDEHRLMISVAWVLDESINEMIIGRDKVFDEFDVEFKQADEEIIFKKRNII